VNKKEWYMAETKKTDAKDKKATGDAASDEEEAPKLDETVPGGRYKVGNEIVNAHGEKVK
jgi:hypothetical protein